MFGEIAGHIMVDSLGNNLLRDYHPYATPNHEGDVDMAREEMRQSGYDSDGDGLCDDPACDGILTVTDEADPYPEQTALLQQNLEAIGITVDVRSFERTTMYSKCEDATEHWALCSATAWDKDYADGFTFGPPLFSRSAIGPNSCCNDTMVGVTLAMLKERGYEEVQVPSAESQIAACVPLTGEDRVQCWADLDRYVMENVVPWVPYLFDSYVSIVSSRVVNYTFDQFAGLPAMDRLAIAGGQI